MGTGLALEGALGENAVPPIFIENQRIIKQLPESMALQGFQ